MFFDYRSGAEWGCIQGLLNIALQQPIRAPDEPRIVSGRECSKKHALSLSEGSIQQGRSHFDARSVLIVREHGKRATSLRQGYGRQGTPLACLP
ncbi:MAG: hypothetical protein IH978_01310 [Nitrospinae bacterium]|nr:hypothetical protein [Nitrospinota bacterium]